MKIGMRLRSIREQLGMDRKQAAELIGVAMPTLAHWENNVNEPNIDKLYKISKVYNVSIADIFGEEKQEDNVKNDTKNMLLDKVIDMLIEEGSLEDKTSFEELDENDKSIIIAVINKFINNKKASN